MSEQEDGKPDAAQNEPALTAGAGEVRKSLDSFVVPQIVPVQMTVAQSNETPPVDIND